MFALGLVVGLGIAVFTEVAVAFGTAATGDHHGPVLVFSHAGHGACHLLEARAMQLGGNI